MLLAMFFFFNDTATTEIYTLSLHDALPISLATDGKLSYLSPDRGVATATIVRLHVRSEEHTSELQSRSDLVCRLLLEKKKLTSAARTTSKPITTWTARAQRARFRTTCWNFS